MPRPHFYFNGCSFTEGAELENKEEDRFCIRVPILYYFTSGGI